MNNNKYKRINEMSIHSQEHGTGINYSVSDVDSKAPKLVEPFAIRIFNESGDPEAALRMQQMQAESYVRFNIAPQSAVEPDGTLSKDLDHARGDHVTYYHATPNMPGILGEASARVINGAITSLPAYTGCLDAIYPEYKDVLNDMAEDGMTFREVGAVALTKGTSSIATFSIVRDVVQDAIRNDRSEVLIGRQTQHALNGFKAMFGSIAVKTIGTGSVLQAGEDMTVELTPVFAEATKSLDNLLAEIKQPETDEKIRGKLTQSLMFLMDGLYKSEVSDEVNEYISTNFGLVLPTKG